MKRETEIRRTRGACKKSNQPLPKSDVMADGKEGEDDDKIQRQESDDALDEGEDQAIAPADTGARPKITNTTSTSNTKTTSRRQQKTEPRRETRATTKAKNDTLRTAPAQAAEENETPTIQVNGQSQNVDKNLSNSQTQSGRRKQGAVEASAGAFELPTLPDYEYRSRFSRGDDDDSSDHDYKVRRTQSADDRSRLTFHEWAEQILNSPHMKQYMSTRHLYTGQPPSQHLINPTNYPTYGQYGNNVTPAGVHLFVPPAPQPPVNTVNSTSLTSVTGQQQNNVTNNRSVDDRRSQSAATMGQRRSPSQDAHSCHDTSTENSRPLDTSTPTATHHQTSARKSRRDSLRRTPTNVSRTNDVSSRRHKGKPQSIEFVTSRTSSETRDTSTCSDTEDQRGGSKTRVRAPTFNGTDFHVFKERFLASAEYAGWSERDKKIQLINNLKKPATDVLGNTGRHAWTADRLMDELEKMFGQNRPFIEVQTELLSMRRKLKQDLHAFAAELRAVARQARMTEEQKDWLLRTAFMVGIGDYPNTRAYVERESKNKVSLQEAVDLAVEYERDYPIEHAASRIASHTAQEMHFEDAYYEQNQAEINWIPRDHYNQRFHRGGRYNSNRGGHRQYQDYNQQYQPRQQYYNQATHLQQKVQQLEQELAMLKMGNQSQPNQQQNFQQQQYGDQQYSQHYKYNRDSRFDSHRSRPGRGNFGSHQRQQQPFSMPRHQQQWQPRQHQYNQQQFQQRNPYPRQQTPMGMNNQTPRPAIQSMQAPHQTSTIIDDDYAQAAAMMQGAPTQYDAMDNTQHVTFQDEPQVMSAPAEEQHHYDVTDPNVHQLE